MGDKTDAAPLQPIQATVDAGQVSDPITKYIYGQFIEHLGNLINHGLWAEMLDDRKFYHPIGYSPPPDTPPFRRGLRTWQPVGPADSVSMDETNAYVGDHSPCVQVVPATPHGIQQSGLTLRQGQRYVGRVVLAGDADVAVQVSLIWGNAPSERQTISVGPLHKDYAKFPLEFVAGAASGDGRLEIVGTGRGSFHIGAVSLMPDDNIRGFRADSIALLKLLRSGIYRFPGGNYVSNYDWRDAIGDPDKRPPHWDYAWGVMQPNDVGTDEFMVLCELLDVEPYITVNAGFGEARSAADWVEYTNGAPDTPMGKLRAANGHPEPYGVKWWGIGNEAYGWWQLGYMSLDHFVIKHNLFAKAMRKVDPTIKLIASGACPDEMTVTTNARRVTGKVVAEYGSKADWTGGLLTHCGHAIDVLSEHYYCYDKQRFDLDAGQYVAVDEPLIDWARRPANRVRGKADAFHEYLKRHPVLRERRIFMAIDEWAYARVRPNLKVALSYAWAFHEKFRHTDCIKMAAFTFATSCIDWDDARAALNTNGMVFKLYRDHFGTLPVRVTGNSPQPAPKYPIGGDQPQVNAGSDTYPLDVVAALTEDRRTFTLAVLNPTESAQQLALDVRGVVLRGSGKAWQMTGPHAEAANVLGQEPQVSITERSLDEVPKTLTVAPISINLFAWDIG